ncbi:MAG: 8-amino-7-oxononanoate synthase [Chromatiales bacterium]|nr:8-amino-7-oxononanoate synthase [Chromatiales bacterium]
MAAFGSIGRTLTRLARRGLYRRRRVMGGPQGAVIQVDGRSLDNFCSNDYLGLASDPRVAGALAEAAGRWGAGSGASPLVSGYSQVHRELETALARFTGRDRALLFGSGYAANQGVLQSLLGPRDHVFQDRLNHASLLDGGWLSRAQFHWFAHADTDELRQQLAQVPGDDRGRRLIASDGTFSMDGDLCPLDELAGIAEQHGAWLMIDDAHGIGVHGPGGRGVVDPSVHGQQQVQVLVGTLGKALGTSGAFVAGSEALVELLVQRARHYIYSTAPPPAIAAATLASLFLLESEPWRRERLARHVARFRAGARGRGLPLLPSSTPIQPLVLGDPEAVLAAGALLEARGCLVGTIRPPTVPPGTARLRITLTAAHEPEQIDRLLDALAEINPVPAQACPA